VSDECEMCVYLHVVDELFLCTIWTHCWEWWFYVSIWFLWEIN